MAAGVAIIITTMAKKEVGVAEEEMPNNNKVFPKLTTMNRERGRA